MGSYITQTDLELAFGADNIAKWSNLSGGSTVDAARVAQAVAIGEARVEDRFRDGRYVIPFSGLSDNALAIVKNWMVAFAVAWLYQRRGMRDTGDEEGNKIKALLKDVQEEMTEYAMGASKLNAALNGVQPSAPYVHGG